MAAGAAIPARFPRHAALSPRERFAAGLAGAGIVGAGAAYLHAGSSPPGPLTPLHALAFAVAGVVTLAGAALAHRSARGRVAEIRAHEPRVCPWCLYPMSAPGAAAGGGRSAGGNAARCLCSECGFAASEEELVLFWQRER